MSSRGTDDLGHHATALPCLADPTPMGVERKSEGMDEARSVMSDRKERRTCLTCGGHRGKWQRIGTLTMWQACTWCSGRGYVETSIQIVEPNPAT